jgi:signal transduction histidine kinase
MAISFLAVLRDARAALAASHPSDAHEAALARRLTRELDEAIGRLEGKEPERDLLSIVCHDLKEPLASITMGAGFLQRTFPPSDEPARRVIDAIARSAGRMSQVVGDFHDIARLEGGTLSIDARSCDIGHLLEGVVAALVPRAGERSLSLKLEPPAEGTLVHCDRARLSQVVSKLVENAVKFTPPGGAIVVRAEREAEKVRVSVHDTGRGISEDWLGRIFDRRENARRTPRDGPGLGLAIANQIVELHGGTMGVESRVGDGSTFWFTIPIAS